LFSWTRAEDGIVVSLDEELVARNFNRSDPLKSVIAYPGKNTAMKHFICFFILLIPVFTYGQGPQTLVTVPIAPGSNVKGWIYLPSDYNNTSKKYPVVFFYHGQGEAGTDPYLLLHQGVPQLIANGMRPDNILNPSDGQNYSFIVLSVQHWSWSPNPEWLPYELDWLKQNYRVDTTRIYVTGLSAGGQESFNAVTFNKMVSSLVTAAIPMSPPPLGTFSINMIQAYRIHTWFFTGDADVLKPTIQKYSEECDSVYPSSSKLTVYKGDHCCWNSLYDINWKDPVSGWSIWQWMLTNQKQTIKLTDLKITDLGNKNVRVDFSYDKGAGDEEFHIQIRVKGEIKDILITPQDKTGPNKYSKTINLN
jgi:dienelactone hydrolase